MAPVLTQQRLAKCCRNLKEKGGCCLGRYELVFGHPNAVMMQLCCLLRISLCPFKCGFSLKQRWKERLHLPCMSTTVLWSRHSRKEAFTQLGSLKLHTLQKQQWVRCFFGSSGLAPDLRGLQIISWLSPLHTRLIGLPRVPLFSWL